MQAPRLRRAAVSFGIAGIRWPPLAKVKGDFGRILAEFVATGSRSISASASSSGANENEDEDENTVCLLDVSFHAALYSCASCL